MAPGGECAAIGAGTAACNRFWCRLVEQGPPSRRARARGFARWGWRVCAGSSPTIHAVSLVRLTARSVFSVPCYSGQGATQGRDGGARTMIRHQIAKRLRHGWEIQCASGEDTGYLSPTSDAMFPLSKLFGHRTRASRAGSSTASANGDIHVVFVYVNRTSTKSLTQPCGECGCNAVAIRAAERRASVSAPQGSVSGSQTTVL